MLLRMKNNSTEYNAKPCYDISLILALIFSFKNRVIKKILKMFYNDRNFLIVKVNPLENEKDSEAEQVKERF